MAIVARAIPTSGKTRSDLYQLSIGIRLLSLLYLHRFHHGKPGSGVFAGIASGVAVYSCLRNLIIKRRVGHWYSNLGVANIGHP